MVTEGGLAGEQWSRRDYWWKRHQFYFCTSRSVAYTYVIYIFIPFRGTSWIPCVSGDGVVPALMATCGRFFVFSMIGRFAFWCWDLSAEELNEGKSLDTDKAYQWCSNGRLVICLYCTYSFFKVWKSWLPHRWSIKAGPHLLLLLMLDQIGSAVSERFTPPPCPLGCMLVSIECESPRK